MANATGLLLGWFLNAGSAGAAGGTDDAATAGRLVVKVWDSVPVPKAQWEGARRVVAEAFRTARLEVDWLTCEPGAGPECSCPSARGEVGLRIYRLLRGERRRAGHFSGGAALRTDEEGGRGIAYVFFDRVEGVANEGRLPGHLVLGLVAAHEIAHLLLPPGHSPTGIMQPHLTRRDWMAATKGWLSFEAGDAARMRERLGAWRRPTPVRQHPATWTANIY